MSFLGRHSSGMSTSRKPWGGHNKSKQGKHNAALINAQNNLTGGGTSKQVSAAVRTFTRNNAGKVGAVLTALLAVILAVSLAMPANAADLKGNTVVDPDTTNVWTDYTRPGGQPSTQNVGRIWTDKSVFDDTYTFTNDNDAGLSGETIEKGGSDFLVSLSALSSTSNLKEMVKTSQPLDIVLVLDTSGSMSGTKMTNLKNAANNFINATAENNRGLEQDQQTRLAIVRFASGANTEQQLNYVTDQNAQQYRNTIDGFRANGATYAEEGLQQAQNVLDSNGRDNVQQIVIFFTDGEPNHSNGFDNVVAADAVNTAHEMKQSGTIIYAIGVMNGANASITDDDGFNEYMNGVSSNYPDATARGSNGGFFDRGYYNTTFGERAEGDYYKAASDPDSIEEIFDEISDEVQQGVGSGSPIEENTQEGNTEPGILTFEDQLGNYMQVTSTGAGEDKIQLAYGDQIYTSTSKSAEGYTDTYHFSGEVEGNEIYGAANLSDLVVTVERSDDLATGDKVTVTLPASLLPMRHYDVDTDAGTMTVSQAYPVRLFYGVSLKAEAKTALGDPTSEAYAAIVASQKSADGTSIDFYSNSFVKSAADGSTTASFSPNAGNKFYYYTQDTTLYTNPECTTEANWYTARNATTLYYKDVYWVQTGNGNEAREVTDGYGTVTNGTAEWNAIQRPSGGTYYIPANTQRTERPHTLTDVKEPNETGTAANVLNPSWTAGGDVTQALGNNGKLSFEMPGSLEIKKDVNWGNASDQTKQDKNTFTFVITANVPTGEDEATEPLAGTYNYYVGDSDTAAGQVTFNNGAATLTVTGGTTVRIDGLPAGTTFTVTERGVGQNGWTVTDATSQGDVENTDPADGVVTGTIPAGSQASLTFTNTYHANEVNLSTETTLKVQKNLEGRDWRDTDEFTFEIDGLGNTVGDGITTPEPAETAVTIDDQTADYTKAFDDITFTMPGEYRYSITEDNDTDPINGIDYSAAIYRVVVTVTDDGNGKLVVSKVELQQTQNDAGTMGADAQPVPIEGSTATFTNTYDVNAATTNIDGRKKYTDTTGDNDINYGKFTFQIEALGGYETEGGSSASYTVKAEDVPMPTDVAEGTTTKQVTNTGYNFTFGTISYNGNDAGKTFEYKVTEILGNEQGMTYDGTTEHIVKVKVEEVTTGEGTPEEETYLVATPDMTPEQVSFTNTYDPADATLTGNDAIHGTKTLTGRDMKADETFYFQLTATNDNAQSVLPNAKTVEFGELKFTKAGSYGFTVTEKQPAEDAGWTFDDADGDGFTDTHHVEIVITDKNADGKYDGKLYVESVTSDAGLDQPVQITNSYKTDPVVVGGEDAEQQITVQKSVTGDNTAADAEFNFQLEPVVDDTNTEDVWRANVEAAEDGFEPKTTITGGVTTDASKTATFGGIRFKAAGDYTFKVTEVEGTDDQADPSGWTYDGHEALVTVRVTDDGEGKLKATVSYNNDDATTDADKAVDNAAAFTNSYSTSSTNADTGSADVQLTKVLEGKAWEGDSFMFQIAADKSNPDAPMPEETEVTVSTPTGKDDNNNDQATFDFGSITFDTPGTYVYKVTEVKGNNAGITYSKNEATITITVTDNHDGTLSAGVTIANNVFTNTYASELDYAEGGGLEIVKTFENATMRGFSFTVTPKDQASADKLGIDMAGETFTTKPGETVGDDNASHAEVAVLDAAAEAKFTQDDADDTYTYTVQETAGSEAGVTYDDTEYTVTIITADDGQGGIKVTTTVTDGADYNKSYVYDNDDATENQTAVVPFTNTYKATGELGGNGAVSINATKTLTNRPMVDGEFKFNVTNTNDPNEAVVATGTNDANGTINFSAINYSIDQMLKDVDNGLATPSVVEGMDTFTYTYKVTEDTDSLDDGVSAIDAAGFQLTVTVTDNGNGTLGIVVAYPDGGDGLTFRNTYGEDDQGKATLNINGTKTLDVQSGNNAPSIEGKYTFTLTGSEGAPMPATTEAHNDASGNVTFGDITFTMENVFGDTGVQEAAAADENAADVGNDEEAVDSEASGESGAVSNEADVDAQSATRTKEFTYTVTESGNVSGVDNDTETSKTFTVTVTDNGDGSLSVESNPAQGALFSFTNTYNVDLEESSPTGEGGITITKNLDGRNLNDGEFTFELVDQNDTVVATGTNDANGNVELDTVKFTEPGNFTYTIREAKGSLGGVDYDAVQYKAIATVTDNGDGTLKVEWSFADASNNGLGENAGITFNNTYTAQPTSVSLGTGKLIEGRALAAGEFTFKLADADGNEISTATNEENGAVTFDTITYDTPGDYTYTITEVAPQDTDPFTDGIQNNGVTYDESVYNATVKVTDNGKGNLTAQISYSTEDGTAPLFVNTYTPPAEPEQGTDDGGLFGMAKTGDFMGGMMAVIAAVIAAAAGGAAYAVRKMRRPRGRHAR